MRIKLSHQGMEKCADYVCKIYEGYELDDKEIVLLAICFTKLQYKSDEPPELTVAREYLRKQGCDL